jgi:hypothetical protein
MTTQCVALEQLDKAVDVLQARFTVEHYAAVKDELSSLLAQCYKRREELQIHFASGRDEFAQENTHLEEKEGPGRRAITINAETIRDLRASGAQWTEIAQLLNVSTTTLYRRRMEESFDDPYKYTEISDQDLRSAVADILSTHPNAGQTMIQGALEGKGTH